MYEMKAAILHEVSQPLRVDTVELGEVQPTEVLVRMAVAGMCHTDLHFVDGKWPCKVPMIMGHEGAGVVESVGSAVTRVAPGDHVVAFNAPPCGRCKHCLRGRTSLCPFPVHSRPSPDQPRVTLNGAPIEARAALGTFAEYMIVNEAAVMSIRKDIPFEAAALVSCAVMAGFGGVAFGAKVHTGESVAVIGAGGVGLNAVQAARHAGAYPIVAVDKNERSLELARSVGATHTINASEQDPVAAVRTLFGGVDHAIEAIGLKLTTEQAWHMLDPGGRVTVLGMIPVADRIEITPEDLLMEKSIKGSHMGSAHWEVQVPILLDLYRNGQLQLDSLVTRRLSLDEVNDGYDHLRTDVHGRQVIVF